MGKAEKIASRIDALDWYYEMMEMPSTNVKVHRHIKDIDEIADTLPASPFKNEAIAYVKSIDESDGGSYFWRACEIEGGYIMNCLFDGVAWNNDEPEMIHVRELAPYKNRSGFFGRSGGHFCIGISRGDLEDMAEEAKETGDFGGVERLLDAIEWGLDMAGKIAKGVPDTIADIIGNDIAEKIYELEEEAEERATPRYKIDRLREWEKTLTDKERDAIARSVKSIEKQLSTLAGNK